MTCSFVPGTVQFMNAFDRAMNLLDEKYSFIASTKQIVSSTNEEDKVQMALSNRHIPLSLILEVW